MPAAGRIRLLIESIRYDPACCSADGIISANAGISFICELGDEAV